MDVKIAEYPIIRELLPSFTFVLTHLELYNWGAFNGRHGAQIDIQGTAIIGATGSGKTTLVDALMTLIVANPRYNLASTGGHESDRDLISYIRGVSGAGNESGNNEHIVRSENTVTGIAARFSSGEKHLRIGAVFWLDGSSSATADLKRLWIFSEADAYGLDEWLEAQHRGGARALKQLGKEITGVRVYDSKQTYLAGLRNFFEVGENAFTLLNRAAGLKQLNSIDEIFRELVLDDNSAFLRASEVAKEFDDLAAIHKELEVARQQQGSLLPIASGWQTRQGFLQKLILDRELQGLLPIWYATHAFRLWADRIILLDAKIDLHEQQSQLLIHEITTHQRSTDTLHAIFLKAGGANINALEDQIRKQTDLVNERSRHATDYRVLATRFGWDASLTLEALLGNQKLAGELQGNQKNNLDRQKLQAWTLGVAQQRHEEERNTLQAELQEAQARPDSNIAGAYHRFRTDLAQHLAMEESGLPYIAELVEIKPDEARWRGAIERAIGSHRLRLLVPSGAATNKALAWVNQRDNQLHVRLLEVRQETTAPEFFADGFTRKLKFKSHDYRESLKHLLADIDRHCVASPEQLRHTPHGMTEQGLMSGKDRFFEKQDQRSLHSDWMTGFDNKDRLAALRARLKETEVTLIQSRAAYEKAQGEAEATQQNLRLLDRLLELQFSQIDQPGAERELESFRLRLRALSDPDSDAEKARSAWQQVDAQLRHFQQQERDRAVAKEVLKKDRQSAMDSQARAARRIGNSLTSEQRELATQHLPLPVDEQLLDFSDQERQADVDLRARIGLLDEQLKGCEQALIRTMEKAQKADTGALSEMGTEMQDVPAYLERLRVLVEEALPEKMQRFLKYLNQSSDQGVTQLLSEIENNVSTIEERIEDLNRTLRRVDFQPGKYLRLVPKRIVHESLRTLQQAQRQLRSAALKDDQGESHFKALQEMVMLLRDAAERKKVQSSRALLDPRYRLQFAVSVIDRTTAAVIETRTGSQGGSGGEKEIIASYVLTASLSYALCPDGGSQPLFGTIVLDEAFSKSSQAVAGRIIRALSEFGLHPLFVTPNKEMRLLREYTRSAILVHRREQNASMTSLSWEELDQQRRSQNSPVA